MPIERKIEILNNDALDVRIIEREYTISESGQKLYGEASLDIASKPRTRAAQLQAAENIDQRTKAIIFAAWATSPQSLKGRQRNL
jgi:hypothetical protein